MGKLIMLRGLPASGKSTYAKEMVRTKGYKRVNRDDLRQMIDNGEYSPENEVLVRTIRDEILIQIGLAHQTAIIDDTNLKFEEEEHFKDLAREWGFGFQVVNFDVPVDECIHRDSFRGIHSVGEKVIRDMYDKYLKTGD